MTKLLKRSTFWLTVIICIMGGFIIYLEGQIIDLETRLVAMQDGSDDNHFGPRITNLEYIINAHTETLHDHKKDLWTLNHRTTELNWRVNKIEWDNPNQQIVVQSKLPSHDYMSDFDPNPGKVPDPQLTKEDFNNPGAIPPRLRFLVP